MNDQERERYVETQETRTGDKKRFCNIGILISVNMIPIIGIHSSLLLLLTAGFMVEMIFLFLFSTFILFIKYKYIHMVLIFLSSP